MIQTLLTLALLALPQAQTDGTAEETVLAAPAQPDAVCWNGDPKGVPGYLRKLFALEDAEIAREAARLKVDVQADGNPGLVLSQVTHLRLRASHWAGDPAAQIELLVDLAKMRGDLLTMLGRPNEAQAALAQLLPTKEEASKVLPARSLVPPGKDLEERLERIGKPKAVPDVAAGPYTEDHSKFQRDLQLRGGDPLPASAIAGLDPQDLEFVRQRFGLPSGHLFERVTTLLLEGNLKGLRDLGRRASPSLALLVLHSMAHADGGKLGEALETFWNYDEDGCIDLLYHTREREEGAWPRRVAGLLNDRLTTSNRHWIYTPTADRSTTAVRPELLDVLTALLERPSSRELLLPGKGGSAAALTAVFEMDGLTPPLQRALGDYLQKASDEDALVLLGGSSVRRLLSGRPVFGAGLRNPSPRVRLLCAQRLACLPDARALLEVAADDDPEVRRIVASYPQERDIEVPAHDFTRVVPGWGYGSITPDWMAEMEPALERLLADDDERVRLAAAASIAEREEAGVELAVRAASSPPIDVRRQFLLGTSPRDERLETLARLGVEDPSTEIRRLWASFGNTWPRRGSVDEALQLEVLTKLAQDTDTAVLARVEDICLEDELPVETLCAVLTACAHNEASRFHAGDREDLLDFVVHGRNWRSVSEVLCLLEIGLATDFEPALREALEGLRSHGNRSSGDWRGSAGLLQRLADERLVALFVWAAGSDVQNWGLVERAFGTMDPERAAALRRSVFMNRGLPFVARVKALSGIDGATFDQEASLELRTFLRDEGWKDWLDDDDERRLLAFGATLNERNFIISDLLSKRVLPNQAAHYLTWWFDPEGRAAKSTALTILEYWSERGCAPSRAESIMAFLAQETPDSRMRKVLVSILNTEDARVVLPVMMQQGDRAYVPAIGAMLRSPRLLVSGNKSLIQRDGIETLMAFGGEGVADELWLLLPVVHAQQRQYLLDSIDTLRLLEDERVQGEGQRTRLPKREEAIKALLGMLESESTEVRAEAILGLSAFGEPEVIPLLIPLLEDPEPEVVGAVRTALRRLGEGPGGQ